MKTAILSLATITFASAVNIEREPLLTWAPTPKADAFNMNYGVPHFGEDHDVTETKKSAADAEAKLGHFWDVLAPSPDPPKRNYFVPNFGIDADIVDSMKHMKDQEAVHGTWNLPKS